MSENMANFTMKIVVTQYVLLAGGFVLFGAGIFAGIDSWTEFLATDTLPRGNRSLAMMILLPLSGVYTLWSAIFIIFGRWAVSLHDGVLINRFVFPIRLTEVSAVSDIDWDQGHLVVKFDHRGKSLKWTFTKTRYGKQLDRFRDCLEQSILDSRTR
jgi:hypothetical protein